MKQPIASVADPDGQPLMDTLLGLEVAPSEAYNTVQGTHNMAGKNVIAAMDSRFVETNAKFVETNAKFVETHAMIASIGAELRTLKWICGLSLALSGMLVTVVMGLVLYLLPGAPEPSNATVATAVAEELAPPARPPETDPEDTCEEAAQNPCEEAAEDPCVEATEQDAPQ